METPVATRRRGAANLDDLKAKLGYTEPTPSDDADASADEATETAEAADSSDAAGEAPSQDAVTTAPAPMPAPVDPIAPAAVAASEDYSNVVSEVETETYEFDANAVDPSIKAPASKTLVATAIAAIVAALVGVAIGGIGVANNTVRQMENASIQDAQVINETIRPIASKLTGLDAQVSGMPADVQYHAAFDEALRAAYGEDRPVLDPGLVSGAKTLIVRNDQIGRQLVEYAVATSFLGSMVDRHLRSTAHDMEEIERLQAGLEDEANYGIAIEMETLLARFQAFVADPEASPFTPISAERVTYDSLEVQVQGEGDAQREFYNVTTATGEEIPVLIHDLVVLPREQLLPPVSNENALDRYKARAAQIKELISQASAMQATLLTQLEEIANKPTLFTF